MLVLVIVTLSVVWVESSRLPLVVFQHHHSLYHRLEDMFEDWALQTTQSPEYHAYKTDDSDDFRPLRILYQVGVSGDSLYGWRILLICGITNYVEV